MIFFKIRRISNAGTSATRRRWRVSSLNQRKTRDFAVTCHMSNSDLQLTFMCCDLAAAAIPSCPAPISVPRAPASTAITQASSRRAACSRHLRSDDAPGTDKNRQHCWQTFPMYACHSLIQDLLKMTRGIFTTSEYVYTTILTCPSGQIGFIVCAKTPGRDLKTPYRPPLCCQDYFRSAREGRKNQAIPRP